MGLACRGVSLLPRCSLRPTDQEMDAVLSVIVLLCTVYLALRIGLM